jgi:hypothetical protein
LFESTIRWIIIGLLYGADSPTDRYCFGVAAMNDTFYVIGGHTYTFLGNFAPTPVNEQYTPFGYGTPDPSYDGTPPEITIVSPENKTYYTTSFSLNFSVNEPISWAPYKLDNETEVKTSCNTTISGLSNGLHNITVYAIDEFGNSGASETVYFNVEVPEPFPTAPVAAASVVTVAVVGVGLLVYFKKRKH